MYAVIETGGQQYKIKQGDTLKIEKIPAEVGNTIKFDKVLLVNTGEQCVVGSPYLKDVSVESEVLMQDRHRKVIVFKYKRRKGYQKKRGHRQHFTKVRILKINS